LGDVAGEEPAEVRRTRGHVLDDDLSIKRRVDGQAQDGREPQQGLLQPRAISRHALIASSSSDGTVIPSYSRSGCQRQRVSEICGPETGSIRQPQRAAAGSKIL